MKKDVGKIKKRRTSTAQRVRQRATAVNASGNRPTQVEAALREAEFHYRQLVETVQAIVWRADARTFQFSFVSKEAESLLGYPVERWTAEPTFWTDHIHPDDREWAVSFCAKATQEKKPHEFEYRMIAADGRVIWLRDIVRVVVENDRAKELIGVMVDITERKRAEGELSQRVRQQAAVANLGQRALAGHDLALLMDEAVALVARTLEVEYSKILELLPDGSSLLLRAGVGWKEGCVGHVTVEAGTDSQAGYTLLSDQPVIVEDLRTETRFSGPPLLRDHGVVSGLSVIIFSEGRPFGVLGAHTTQRRAFTQDDIHFLQAVANVLAAAIARTRVEAAQRRLTAILEATTDFVAIADARGRRLYLNRAGRRMVGIGEDEDVSGMTIADAHPEWARTLILTDALPAAIRDGVWSSESALLTRKGREIPVSQVVLAHRAPDGTMEFFSTIARDISERKRTEMHLEAMVEDRTRQLQEALRGAEEASRHKSEFLRNMSHELRTPLNAVIGFAELLAAQHMGPLNAKQARYVDHIHQSGKHLLQIINDILDLTKVEAGKLEIQPEAFRVHDALLGALEEIRPQAEAKRVALHLQEGGDLSTLVADPLRIRQILNNLLDNAVKFTPSGGSVTLSARMTGSPGEEVEIAVADTGIGIKAEDFGRLFHEFTQLDSSMAKRHQGTGLGLALTKRLVELHGGWIQAESPGEGQGSTFTVTLPQRPLRTRESILIVEGDETLCARIAGALQNAGFAVEAAGEVEAALAHVSEAPPALVILDLVERPGEILRRFRERGPARHLPIIALTSGEAAQVDEALTLGADEFLVKPFSLSVLTDAVERLLRGGGRGRSASLGSP